MKKIFAMALAAIAVACNDTASEKTTVTNEDSVNTSSANGSSNTTSGSYAASEGDIKYSGNKVMVYKGGSWVEANEDVKLDNDVVVYRDGRVERGDLEVRLKEGEIVNRTGNLIDDSGNAIANAWEVTKEGAKDAGRAIKNTAKKAVKKADSLIDKDDN